MYISKLKIKNFKCFDEVEINFDPHFNLIIGLNFHFDKYANLFLKYAHCSF